MAKTRNVQCKFCKRGYDCVNESRPGLTSAILPPSRVLDYLEAAPRKINNISVIGIAGPGDPFADGESRPRLPYHLSLQRPGTLITALAKRTIMIKTSWWYGTGPQGGL